MGGLQIHGGIPDKGDLARIDVEGSGDFQGTVWRRFDGHTLALAEHSGEVDAGENVVCDFFAVNVWFVRKYGDADLVAGQCLQDFEGAGVGWGGCFPSRRVVGFHLVGESQDFPMVEAVRSCPFDECDDAVADEGADCVLWVGRQAVVFQHPVEGGGQAGQ